MRTRVLFCIAAAGALDAVPASPAIAALRGAPLSFEVFKVAAEGDPLPNLPDRVFFQFGFQETVVHEGTIYFHARGAGALPTVGGVYTWHGGSLGTVIDSREPALEGTGPSGIGVFVTDVTESCTLVRTRDLNADRYALYRVSGPEIEEVVDSDTLIPGTLDTFPFIGSGRAYGDNVVFYAITPEDHGNIYRVRPEDGAITPLIDESTPFPAFLPHRPEAFFPGGFDGGLLAFRAAEDIGGGFVGVYVTDLDGDVTPIMETPQPAPNGVDTFNSLGGGLEHPSIHNGKVAFGAGDFVTGYTAILVADAITGDTTIIADSDMDLPGKPTGPNVSFGVSTPAIHGDDIAFLGLNGPFGNVLYLFRDGVIHDLLHVGDTLDGRAIKFMEHSVSGFDGTLISVGVTFTDNSRALYVVQIIPAPSPALLVLALLVPRRRRGR